MAAVAYKASSAISAAAKETARICTVIITYDPVITAILLLSIALHRLLKHAVDEWVERRNLPILD